MTSREIVCVVVTFHPDLDVLENLQNLRTQFTRVIVVDNGSSTEELAFLRSAASSIDFGLVENEENLGIATALNIGIKTALDLGAAWILLFDQDSRVTEGFADAMWSCAQSPAAQHIGIRIPRYVDKRTHGQMYAELAADGTIETAMTSGSLIAGETFRQYGLFVEELFIDGVDHEYSLRLRAAGLSIQECAGAMLLHSPGTPSRHRILRSKPFLSSNYSPIRRYYQERNKIWLSVRYGKRFPHFIRGQYRATFKDVVKILLFERDSLRKLRFLLHGVLDGLRNRMGKLNP